MVKKKMESQMKVAILYYLIVDGGFSENEKYRALSEVV